MERILILRHGYPEHMDDGRTGGWTDSHLTDLGRNQARVTAPAVARLLEGREYTFHTSDLSRTAETAREIAAALNRTPVPTDALREQDLGDANGKSTAEAGRIALNPTEGPPVDREFFPHAETWRAMMQRVFAFLDELDDQSPDTALLVSHAGASTCVVFWWLGLPPDRWPTIQFEFDLCSLTELTVGEFQGQRILRLNDVRHLGECHA
jgi:probable phosphoglycerate mutase